MIHEDLLKGEEMPRCITYLPTPEEIEEQKRLIRAENEQSMRKAGHLSGNGKNSRFPRPVPEAERSVRRYHLNEATEEMS